MKGLGGGRFGSFGTGEGRSGVLGVLPACLRVWGLVCLRLSAFAFVRGVFCPLVCLHVCLYGTDVAWTRTTCRLRW